MDDLDTIALGGQPSWSKTFEHADHGPLAFRVAALPTAMQWLAQSTAQDELLKGTDAPSGTSAMLAGAISTLETLMAPLPVVGERREVDPDNPDHEKIVTLRYDPRGETDISYPIMVYLDFLNWRKGLLDGVVELGKDSAGTNGSESVASPLAATDSR